MLCLGRVGRIGHISIAILQTPFFELFLLQKIFSKAQKSNDCKLSSVYSFNYESEYSLNIILSVNIFNIINN